MKTEVEIARDYGFTLSWLRQARVKGNGPAFIKIGAMVRYRDEDVEAFIARHRVTSTSQVA